MRVLLDANVILDTLLSREDHRLNSEAVWKAAETGSIRAFLSAHAVTTIYYVIAKQIGGARAGTAAAKILTVFDVAAVSRAVLQEALQFSFNDFEDAVTAAAAHAAHCTLIVTRDPKGFRNSRVRAVNPAEVLRILTR